MEDVLSVGIPIVIVVFAAVTIVILASKAIRDFLERNRESHEFRARNRDARRVNDLYYAAPDKSRIWRELEKGTPIDAQDLNGNTVLHLAYYVGRQDAVANLIEFGADENLRNRQRLTPAEMADVSSVVDLIRQGIRCLSHDGTWRDSTQEEAIYRRLKACDPRIYNAALARAFLDFDEPFARVFGVDGRRRIGIFAIKLGIDGSEGTLGEMLDSYGDKEMAEDYLNAGPATLFRAAEQWATRNGYSIGRSSGRHMVTWGEF